MHPNLTLNTPLQRLPRALAGWLAGWRTAWAQAQAERRLWLAARADHRVMADCLQAGGRDLDDESGLARTWGRFPEQLPDGRGTATHLRHG